MDFGFLNPYAKAAKVAKGFSSHKNGHPIPGNRLSQPCIILSSTMKPSNLMPLVRSCNEAYYIRMGSRTDSHPARAFPGPALPPSHSHPTPERNPLPMPCMGPEENVDSGVPDGLVWRVSEETFSRTYSAGKIVQTRIVEPIHPLLNKKMLASPGGEIISCHRRSG